MIGCADLPSSVHPPGPVSTGSQPWFEPPTRRAVPLSSPVIGESGLQSAVPGGSSNSRLHSHCGGFPAGSGSWSCGHGGLARHAPIPTSRDTSRTCHLCRRGSDAGTWSTNGGNDGRRSTSAVSAEETRGAGRLNESPEPSGTEDSGFADLQFSRVRVPGSYESGSSVRAR